jgi:peroxiredoxin
MKVSAMLKMSAKVIPWLMILALAASNVLLFKQNLQMRAELDKFNPYLQKGDKVPGFSARGLHGESIQVSYTGAEKERVLLFLSPDCRYSREQFAYWQEILGRADRSRFEILGLVRDSEDKEKTINYIQSINLPNRPEQRLQIAVASQSVLDGYKLSATPTTLVVSSKGEVENLWVGKWDSKIAADASAYFGVQLPQH